MFEVVFERRLAELEGFFEEESVGEDWYVAAVEAVCVLLLGGCV